jgi:Zn-dependent protease with chaperone function
MVPFPCTPNSFVHTISSLLLSSFLSSPFHYSRLSFIIPLLIGVCLLTWCWLLGASASAWACVAVDWLWLMKRRKEKKREKKRLMRESGSKESLYPNRTARNGTIWVDTHYLPFPQYFAYLLLICPLLRKKISPSRGLTMFMTFVNGLRWSCDSWT